MDLNRNNLTYKDILIFWLPLLATLIMMTVEAPFLAAVIARLNNPKYNLAAFGLAYSIAMFFESPIIMIMSASTALVRDRNSFIKLRNFTYVLNGMITFLMLVTLIPPIFRFLFEGVIGLPEIVSSKTQVACFILFLWPAAIGYRRFYQGILIRNNLTRRVSYGTVIRLISMVVTALVSYFFFEMGGAYVGATALLAGVVMEAMASRLMVRNIVNQLLKDGEDLSQEKPLSYKDIINFYTPLASSSMLSLGIRPLVTFFMARSLFAIESLAVFPVIYGLVAMFLTFGWSLQEACIALIGRQFENFKRLKNFALGLGFFATGGLFLIAFTPLSTGWFQDISGLSTELTNFSLSPTRIIAIIPLLHVLVCFFQSSLIAGRFTRAVIKSTAIEVTVITLFLFIGIHYFDMIGIIAAVLALMAGRFFSSVYLTIPLYKAFRLKAEAGMRKAE
jgi:hypothetical protein